VIGINSQKLIKKNVTGIGFALSASDLLEVLHRFYPATSSGRDGNVSGTSSGTVPRENNGNKAMSDPSGRQDQQMVAGVGIVLVSSDPDGAEIFLDGRNVGMTPAELTIPSGNHMIVLKLKQHSEFDYPIEILKGSKVAVSAVMRPD
jgi:hypothetical protein